MPIANDNYTTQNTEPLAAPVTGVHSVSISYPGIFPDQSQEQRHGLSPNLERALTAALILCWGILLVFDIQRLNSPVQLLPLLGQAGLTILSGLSLMWVGKRQVKPVFYEIGTLTALLASLISLMGVNLVYNLNIPPPMLWVMGAGLASAAAWLTKSRLALLMATIMSLAGAYSAVEISMGTASLNTMMPLLCLALIFTINLGFIQSWRSGFAQFLCIVGLYAPALAMFVLASTNAQMSLANATVLLIILGAIQIGFAQILLDKGQESGLVHLAVGVATLLIGALSLQHYWLNSEHAPWNQDEMLAAFSIGGVPYWFIALGGLLGIFGMICLYRLQQGRISFGRALASCAALIAIPLVFIFVGQNMNIPGLDVPLPAEIAALGLGAVVFGGAIALMAQSLHSRSSVLLILAITAIISDMIIVKDALMQSDVHGIGFMLLALVSLVVAGTGPKLDFWSEPKPETAKLPAPSIQLLFGCLMMAAPLVLILGHFRTANNNPQISLQTQVTGIHSADYGQTLRLSTPLSTIDLSAVVGPKRLRVGDSLIVYFNKANATIFYPYAIARRIDGTQCDPEYCIRLRGQILELKDNIMTLHYPFQTLFVAQSSPIEAQTLDLELAYTVSGRTALLGTDFTSNPDDQDLKLVPSPTLAGLINTGARAHPAK